jgi:hypothetical protein
MCGGRERGSESGGGGGGSVVRVIREILDSKSRRVNAGRRKEKAGPWRDTLAFSFSSTPIN